MKRFAAHYIFLPPGHVFKLHRIELDENRKVEAIRPLERETAFTVFLNGLILVVNENTFRSDGDLLAIIEDCGLQYPGSTFFELLDRLSLKEISAGSTVNLYHLYGTDLLTTKFRTDNGCSNCHIQRLY